MIKLSNKNISFYALEYAGAKTVFENLLESAFLNNQYDKTFKKCNAYLTIFQNNLI